MGIRRQTDPGDLPAGFRYQPEFLSVEEEADLQKCFKQLTFRAFEFQGHTAKRRIADFGWEYDFSSRRAIETKPLPEFLFPIQERAAIFAGVPERELVETLVTEYPPGAPIGWHRDVPQFEDVIGVSLGSACRMRFKPHRQKGKLVWITLEPRSIYLMRGPVRWQFQHSIPAVEAHRYSITFRTLRKSSKQEVA
ncbi:MAG TPA: alpha-ketoglutarate-dependent dioxygenase AlkB [Terriglobales bacterium]|nr:alpha-ketoglutarate-dependent dioxygenase AlkB [Terriglobales bacterium]